MNISELFTLTQWIEQEIKNQQIPQRYNNLRDALQANTKPDQPKRPFESQKTDLLNAIANVPLDSLTEEQFEMLKVFGIRDNVGSEAVSKIEDALFRNSLDIATAAQTIGKFASQVQEGVQRSDALRQSLAGLAPKERSLEERVLVRVTFKNEAAISNVVDFKTYANVWYDIGRGIAMINDATPEHIQVVGAGQGSIIVELATAYAIASTIAAIMLEALKVAERVIDIQKKAEEVKGMKLGNAKIAKELEDAAKEEKMKGIEAITANVAKHKHKKENAEGDKVVALERAVKLLIEFLQKGGSVDCVIPETKAGAEAKPEAEEIKSLRKSFREIRQLEFHLKQIEDHKPTSDAQT